MKNTEIAYKIHKKINEKTETGFFLKALKNCIRTN